MQGEEGGMPGMLGTMPATGGGISVPSGVSAYVAATGATQGTSGPVTLPHTGTTPAPGIGWQPGSVQPNSVAAASAVANAAAASAVANAAADPTPQNVAVAAATASAAVAAAEAAADVAGATAAAFPSSANVELAQTAAATAATAKIIDAAVSAMSGAQVGGPRSLCVVSARSSLDVFG